jgi:hypothetical protein
MKVALLCMDTHGLKTQGEGVAQVCKNPGGGGGGGQDFQEKLLRGSPFWGILLQF